MDAETESNGSNERDNQLTTPLLERSGPRIAYSKVTGYPYVTARPGVPKITSEEIWEMLEDFP